MAYVDYDDVAEVAAIALTEPRLTRGTFELAAPGEYTGHDLAAHLGEALGRPVRAEQVALEDYGPAGPLMANAYAREGFAALRDYLRPVWLPRRERPRARGDPGSRADRHPVVHRQGDGRSVRGPGVDPALVGERELAQMQCAAEPMVVNAVTNTSGDRGIDERCGGEQRREARDVLRRAVPERVELRERVVDRHADPGRELRNFSVDRGAAARSIAAPAHSSCGLRQAAGS